MANAQCIFCRIIGGEIPADVVHDGGAFVAFRDIAPKAPVHILIIPRRHIASLNDVESKDGDLMGRMLLAARAIAEQEGVAEAGYRVVVNTGWNGGQSVDHMHFHVLGGRPMQWPPG